MPRTFLDIMPCVRGTQANRLEVSLLVLSQLRPQHITNTAGAVFQWESAYI